MISKYKANFIIAALTVTQFIFAGCERNLLGGSSQKHDQEKIEKLRNEILALSESVPCDNPQEWRFIPMGYKACGGPQEYVLYSTKIDTNDFKKKVEEYTIETRNLSKKWSIASDCMYVLPPGGVKCDNGKAVPLPYFNIQAIIGTWKLTESLADPGDGSGKYKPVAGPAQFITFDSEGKVSGDAIKDISRYRILDDVKIEAMTPQNTSMIFRYKIVGNLLELNAPCIEACGLKFIRM